jgi:hypothetical protein
VSLKTGLLESSDFNAKLMDFRIVQTTAVSFLTRSMTETGAVYLLVEKMAVWNELISVHGFMNYNQAKVRQCQGLH